MSAFYLQCASVGLVWIFQVPSPPTAATAFPSLF